MNIQKYIEHLQIGYPLQPTFQYLCALQKAHLLRVPFENLDIHYGRSITLDQHRIYEKIVTNNRGGFCYELNSLYNELLREIGFDTKIISARVYSQQNGYGAEYDHLTILANVDDNWYLTDVGFGEFALEPLAFELNTVQHDSRGDFIIEQHDDHYYRISKITSEERIPQFLFSEQKRALDEFSEMCHYHQTHPTSPFTQKRFVSLPREDGGRITLSSQGLTLTKADGTVEKHNMSTEAAFRKMLWDYFGIQIDE